MSLPQIDKELLKIKTNEIVLELINFSRTLPEEHIYSLKQRIYDSARNIPNGFLNDHSEQRVIDTIKDLIKFGGRIEECKDYLHISKTLRFGNPDNLIEKLEELKKLTKINTAN